MRRLIWFWQAPSNGEPLTPVICHSVVTAAGSLSLFSLYLSLSATLSSLSLSLPEVILTTLNKTKPISFTAAGSLSLSICHSLSLFLFLSEVILTATEQQIPVYKHYASTISFSFSLCHKGLPSILSYRVLQVRTQITESKNPSTSK